MFFCSLFMQKWSSNMRKNDPWIALRLKKLIRWSCWEVRSTQLEIGFKTLWWFFYTRKSYGCNMGVWVHVVFEKESRCRWGGGGVKVTPSHICQCRAIPCGTVITYKCLRWCSHHLSLRKLLQSCIDLSVKGVIPPVQLKSSFLGKLSAFHC